MLAPNVPALLEAHYGVPMAGAVLNALNYRLDARSIAFILGHGEAKLLIADREFAPLAQEALRELGKSCHWSRSPTATAACSSATIEYEDFLAEGDPDGAVVAARRTNGRRSRSTTPPARPATPKASSITTAAPF